MILATIILIVVVGLFFLIWNVTRDRGTDLENLPFVDTKENEMDITILGLLLSRQETEYLRRQLSEGDFRAIRRSRLSLARAYLKTLNKNVGQIVRAAEAAAISSDREVAKAAREVLSIAFRIRLNVPLVHLCLIAEWLLPTVSLVAPARVDAYQQAASRLFFILRRLPRIREMSPVG